jgi:hypothetical protein
MDLLDVGDHSYPLAKARGPSELSSFGIQPSAIPTSIILSSIYLRPQQFLTPFSVSYNPTHQARETLKYLHSESGGKNRMIKKLVIERADITTTL